MDSSVTVYGADWCADSIRAAKRLRALDVGFHYVNVDADPMGSEEVRELNNGNIKLPTVVVEGRGTRILAVPTDVELCQALVETNILANPPTSAS